MRFFILAAAMIAASAPILAVTIPGAADSSKSTTPEKLTALPSDWLDKDVPATADKQGTTVADATPAAKDPAATTEPCDPPSGTTGLIIGAVAGGLLGNVVDGGSHRALGTIVGAGGGALLGRSIEQKRACK